jgi:hypothetical protein
MIFKVFRTVLIAAIVLVLTFQVISIFTPAIVTSPGPISEVIPEQIAGWKGTPIPIAETEELQEQTAEILKFDEALSYRYERGKDYINIYIAYWEPGKVPIRKVGVHTPDTCWVQNGWKRQYREYAQVKDVNGVLLQPCEYGIFSLRDHEEHVLFWHLVGGKVHSYKQHGLHDIWSPVRDLFNKGFHQKADQYFIRLSSNRSLYDFWEDPGFQELLMAIGKLGVLETDLSKPASGVSEI